VGKRKSEVAKSLDIPKSLLSTILKNKDSFREVHGKYCYHWEMDAPWYSPKRGGGTLNLVQAGKEHECSYLRLPYPVVTSRKHKEPFTPFDHFWKSRKKLISIFL